MKEGGMAAYLPGRINNSTGPLVTKFFRDEERKKKNWDYKSLFDEINVECKNLR